METPIAKRYAQFNENGSQIQTIMAQKPPGSDWRAVPEKYQNNPILKLKNGEVTPVTKNDLMQEQKASEIREITDRIEAERETRLYSGVVHVDGNTFPHDKTHIDLYVMLLTTTHSTEDKSALYENFTTRSGEKIDLSAPLLKAVIRKITEKWSAINKAAEKHTEAARLNAHPASYNLSGWPSEDEQPENEK